MTAAPSMPRRTPLEEAVELAVAQRSRVAAWPKLLREAYAEDRRDTGRRELRHLQIVGLLVTLLSIALDFLIIPDNMARGALLRALLVMPVAAISIAFARKMPLGQLKLAVGYTLIAFAAIVVHLAGFADPATATRYTMSTTLMLAMALMLLPYQREELVVFAGVYCLAVLGVGMGPQALPPLLMLEHMVMTLLVGGAALVIAVRHSETAARNFLFGLRDSFTRAELEQNVRILRELSESDALTGLANRRSFRSSFDNRFAASTRAPGLSVTVMMIDLDHFKRFNDEFGHQAGDRALRHVGRCLEAGFSGVDGIVARFGGEEFIAAFHSVSVAEAERLAEDVRGAICALDIPVRDNLSQRITTSIGLASAGPEAKVDLGELTARADRALYRAKSDGRNRVVSSEKIELRIDRLAG
ncbi:GGDEF domain-containing protein [Erythrobacter sp. SDW2]|uniref:GGDEF domain-containing protein n=1 Tax=Erythrobacter sp. SDW2 TaxID=2907154 RepID=UPI001F34661A|nr:GGDEF domain-containing protein [Erythrobacter sp. SDW2]UIP07576.1 GGDEF domain-containing protein [Erythrobacter sp. SDW2]